MPRRAEPLTIEEENQLWQCRLLGEHSPQALLDTMLFLCGMYFALRSGQEHRNLVMSQIKIVEPTNGLASYIAYTEKCFQKSFGRASTEEGGAQTGDSSPKHGKSISVSSPLDETVPQPLSKSTTTKFLLGSTYQAQI